MGLRSGRHTDIHLSIWRVHECGELDDLHIVYRTELRMSIAGVRGPLSDLRMAGCELRAASRDEHASKFYLQSEGPARFGYGGQLGPCPTGSALGNAKEDRATKLVPLHGTHQLDARN